MSIDDSRHSDIRFRKSLPAGLETLLASILRWVYAVYLLVSSFDATNPSDGVLDIGPYSANQTKKIPRLTRSINHLRGDLLRD